MRAISIEMERIWEIKFATVIRILIKLHTTATNIVILVIHSLKVIRTISLIILTYY